MSWPRVVLLLSALPFALVGLAFLVAPVDMAALVDLEAIGAIADNDLRGVYGGLSLGCAALLAWCSANDARTYIGVHAQVFMYGGLAAGRAVSLAIAGVPDALGVVLHGGEIVALVCGLTALRQVRHPSSVHYAGRL
jgi:hypothetical protein